MELVPGNSLITATPEEGRQLAVTLARKTIGFMQPDKNVREVLRPAYASDAESPPSVPDRCVIGVLSSENPDNATIEGVLGVLRAPRGYPVPPGAVPGVSVAIQGQPRPSETSRKQPGPPHPGDPVASGIRASRSSDLQGQGSRTRSRTGPDLCSG